MVLRATSLPSTFSTAVPGRPRPEVLLKANVAAPGGPGVSPGEGVEASWPSRCVPNTFQDPGYTLWSSRRIDYLMPLHPDPVCEPVQT